jgi:hypothetical protein
LSAVEDRVCLRLQERADAGLRKYGVTMERTDLSELEWLNHALEETLDLAVYLQRMIDIKTSRTAE